MKTIWLFLCRFWALSFLKLRVYKFWSNVYRWLWESQWSDLKVSTYVTLSLITERARAGWWRADSWKQLFDAVSSPQYVEAVWSGQAPVPTEGFDCDEFAIYLTAAIAKSLENGVMTDELQHPRFFTVLWMEKDGWTPRGHNVCLVSRLMPRPDGLGVVPTHRQWAFVDYSALSAWCDSIDDVAKQVRDAYAKESTPIGYCVSALDLTPYSVVWGR